MTLSRTFGSQMGHLMGLVATLLFAAMLAEAAASEPPSSLQDIRSTADGAGPSHIFWLSGPTAAMPNADVIGIVDPLLAAIRLYSVDRTGEKLDQRLKVLGVCAIPVSFRPWRILHLKNEVRIESMPKPGTGGHNANREDFLSDVYSLKRDLIASAPIETLKSAGSRIKTSEWNPAADIQCGAMMQSDARVGSSAPFTAVRGVNRPKRTIIWRGTPDSLSPGGPLIVRARTGGQYYLFSARELEPAAQSRVVLITEGVPTADGMVRLNQRLLVFGKDGSKPDQEIGFDDTHFRSKIGIKPLAVLPTGEVLAMGRELVRPDPRAEFEVAFRIQSCGSISPGAKLTSPLCSDAGNIVKGRQDADSTPALPVSSTTEDPADLAAKKQTANSIFANVRIFAEQPWDVNTSVMPDECRVVEGCRFNLSNKPFVPLKGIRLTRGPYRQTGFPYAQTETFRDVDKFFDAVAGNRLTAALRDLRTKQEGLPGNLMDKFVGDLGIDCSAFVQMAWNGRPANSIHRISTDTLQNARLNFVCPNRLPDQSYLRSGDAIGIHVSPGADHVVLYAANIPFDGASEFWLVQESTSACDGVCWSVYDPSFFNGWGLYRASNRSDKGCLPATQETSIVGAPLPATFDKWRDRVVKGLPLNR